MLPAPTTQLAPTSSNMATSGRRENRTYTLVVEQQPDRARMCGFGDKDRRPITPPPCVRLIIRDASTGREIENSEVNAQHFILNVDLWDSEASHEVNLVRHSSTSPSVSISMASTTSYPPPPEHPPMMLVPGPPGQPPQYAHLPMHGGEYYAQNYGYPGALIPHNNAPQAGMYTRNLIGSVTVSASSLQDLSNKYGFWFVLQDLSVRTEGSFRLKLSFIDVSGPGGSLNSGACPVLASCFSDVFTVWSAKKFPGVKESTPLSKCFATQGVKIPIRKDNAKTGSGDYDQDD